MIPGLESFPLASNGLFHVLILLKRWGPSCTIHLLSCLEQASLDVIPDVLSGSISYTCKRTHMQVEDLLEMTACLRVFKLPNFKARGELVIEFWWHINPHVTYKKLMLLGYFLARDYFYICDKFRHGPMEKDDQSLYAWLCFQTCTWWDGSQGPVVQSVVSLTSSLRVISLTVLADSIHNILIFFAEKMWVAFALQKLLTFFQQKISAYLRITRCKF